MYGIILDPATDAPMLTSTLFATEEEVAAYVERYLTRRDHVVVKLVPVSEIAA
jgi:hypothetical protein